MRIEMTLVPEKGVNWQFVNPCNWQPFICYKTLRHYYNVSLDSPITVILCDTPTPASLIVEFCEIPRSISCDFLCDGVYIKIGNNFHRLWPYVMLKLKSCGFELRHKYYLTVEQNNNILGVNR